MTIMNLNNFMFTENIVRGFILQERLNYDTPDIVKEKLIIPKSITIKEILQQSSFCIPTQKEEQPKKEIYKPLKKRFVPRKNDTLFWIFYIIIHGFTEYELIGNNDFEIEQTEKYKYIEYLRKDECKQLLKKHKITKIKEDIENELGHTSRIGHKTFFALCVCYKLNIIFN